MIVSHYLTSLMYLFACGHKLGCGQKIISMGKNKHVRNSEHRGSIMATRNGNNSTNMYVVVYQTIIIFNKITSIWNISMIFYVH